MNEFINFNGKKMYFESKKETKHSSRDNSLKLGQLHGSFNGFVSPEQARLYANTVNEIQEVDGLKILVLGPLRCSIRLDASIENDLDDIQTILDSIEKKITDKDVASQIKDAIRTLTGYEVNSTSTCGF